LAKTLSLWRGGVRELSDIPEGSELSGPQALQVDAAQSGRVFVDRDAIAEFLSELQFPLFFLDFETINPAIPPYDGLKPFEQLTFEASVHIQERPGGPLVHEDFLGDGKSDPRPGMISFLTRVIGGKGTVVAYNKSFEGGCLAQLARFDGERSKELLSMRERLWDLAEPFRKAHYVHPKFYGSWSIKYVLPALVPEMRYEGMAISDGAAAQLAYLRLMKGKVFEAERRKTIKDLKDYCGQDTMAMVRVLGVLKREWAKATV
jgi:hypothetical protein